MAKIKDFYNPVIGGTQFDGFIKAIESLKDFGSNWYTSLGAGGIDALDNYIKLKVGEREVFKPIGELGSVSSYINMSNILMSYNYQLDGLYELLIPNDGSEGGYNPLDNVNEVRHEVTDTDYDKGEDSTKYNKGSETTTLNGGERTTSTNNPTRTDTQTNDGKTTAFDTDDYSKGTDETTSSTTYGAFEVTSNSDSFTDTSVNGAREDETTNSSRHDDTKITYDVTRHGNIGVTTSFDLIQGDRKLHYYNFFNEVVNVIIREFLSSMLWEV